MKFLETSPLLCCLMSCAGLWYSVVTKTQKALILKLLFM